MRFPASQAWLAAICLAITCILTGCGPWQSTPASPNVIASGNPDFTLAVTPATASMLGGATPTPFALAITPLNGFSAAISITVTANPTALACTETACTTNLPAATTTGQLHLAPPSSATPGAYTLTLTATSGTLVHTATATLTILPPVTVVTPADFTFTVSPTSSSTTAGTAAPPYSFTITPSNGFASPVTITGTAPTGFTCAQSPCSVTSSATQIPNALQFTPTSTAIPGTYTLIFTATSGSLVHTAVATITIPAPEVTVIPCSGRPLTSTASVAGSTTFTYTGDGVPPAAVYDSKHNVIFVSNKQLGELEIVSANTSSIMSRIPLSTPEGLDLTADLSTLIVGTDTPYFYEIDTTTLCVKERPYIATVSGVATNLTTGFPISLADGSIVFDASSTLAGELDPIRWTEAGGAVWLDSEYARLTTLNIPKRSGDHMHLYYLDNGSFYGALLVRLDVATGQKTTYAVNSVPTLIAVNFDGSRIYFSSEQGSVTLTDASFNTLASFVGVGGTQEGFVLSPQTSRLYVLQGYYPYLAVLDASTLAVLGYQPAQGIVSGPLAGGNFGGSTYDTIDGIGRILTSTANGLDLIDLSAPLWPTPGPAAIAGPSIYSSIFDPANPVFQLDYTINGGDQASTAAVIPTSVTFRETPTSLAGSITSGTLNGYPYISVTPPVFPSGCADVTVNFNVGLGAFGPQAFCYGTTVLAVDGDSGPSTGGGTVELWGNGFAYGTTVDIGGNLGTRVSGQSVGGQTDTVPPGMQGPADIAVNLLAQTLTLPGAYTYYDLQTAPIVSNATPSQIIYDAARDRLLWTDSTRNLLVVSSSSTGQTLQEVPVGNKPLGLALSPDGTKIAVATAADYSVAVYDAVTFSKNQSVSLPAPTTPVVLVYMNNGKILVQAAQGTNSIGYYDNPAFYKLDVASNALTSVAGFSSSGSTLTLPSTEGCSSLPLLAAAADGSTAVVADYLYTAATDSFSIGLYMQCPAISADGAVIATPGDFLDSSLRVQNTFHGPLQISDSTYATPCGCDPYSLSLNASGSLAYVQTGVNYYVGNPSPVDRFRVYDTANGRLRRTIVVPGLLNTPQNSQNLALDPAGQRLWTFTSSGLAVISFLSDPLAVGEVKINNGTITLLGSGFNSALALTIDGQAVSPLNVSGTTTATALLPTLSSGIHSLTVTLLGGAAQTLSDAFTTP